MNSIQGISLGTCIFTWFLIPWVISGYHIVRASIYESKIKLYSGVQALDFPEMFRRIKERRKEDKTYDELRAKTWRWFIITVIWWVASFILLLAIIIIGSLIKDS